MMTNTTTTKAPKPSVPVSDPRQSASSMQPMPDPYKQAAAIAAANTKK